MLSCGHCKKHLRTADVFNIYIYMCVYIYINVNRDVSIYIYIYIYIHYKYIIYQYMYIYIYIHAYIYMHSLFFDVNKEQTIKNESLNVIKPKYSFFP